MGPNESATLRKPQIYQKKPSSQPAIKAFRTNDQWKTYFDSCKSTYKLVVINFTATWCKPCQFMEPVLDKLCEKHTDVDFVRLDVDKFSGVAEDFGVYTLPTCLLIKKEDQVDKVVGVKIEELKAKIEKHKGI